MTEDQLLDNDDVNKNVLEIHILMPNDLICLQEMEEGEILCKIV